MIVAATPVLPVSGVPDPRYLKRYGISGLGLFETVDWGSLLTGGVQAGTELVTTRWGVPQIPEGTLIQTKEGIMLKQQPGYPVVAAPAATTTGLDIPWGTGLALAGAAVMIVIVMTRGGGGGGGRRR